MIIEASDESDYYYYQYQGAADPKASAKKLQEEQDSEIYGCFLKNSSLLLASFLIFQMNGLRCPFLTNMITLQLPLTKMSKQRPPTLAMAGQDTMTKESGGGTNKFVNKFSTLLSYFKLGQ